MSDGMDELKDLIRHQQGQRQIGATNQVVSELQRQNEILQRQNQALQPKGPPCPFCGGVVPMSNAELCTHCRSKLAWVEGVICKPGTESQVLNKIKRQQAEIDAKHAAYLEETKRTLGSAKKEYSALIKALKKSSLQYRLTYLPFIGLALLGIINTNGWLIIGSLSVMAIALTVVHLAISPEQKREKIQQLESRYGKENLQ